MLFSAWQDKVYSSLWAQKWRPHLSCSHQFQDHSIRMLTGTYAGSLHVCHEMWDQCLSRWILPCGVEANKRWLNFPCQVPLVSFQLALGSSSHAADLHSIIPGFLFHSSCSGKMPRHAADPESARAGGEAEMLWLLWAEVLRSCSAAAVLCGFKDTSW